MPEQWDLYKHGFTQSMLQTFLLCPQKAKWRYKENLTAFESTAALNFGDIFHRVLDNVYSNPSQFNSIEDAVIISLQKIKEDDKAKLHSGVSHLNALVILESNIAQLQIMLEAYFNKWIVDFEDLDWISLEEIFEARWGDVPIRGKFDGFYKDKNGHLTLFETKTKSQIDEKMIGDTLNFDLQVMLYSWAGWQLKKECPRKCVYNLIRRPKLEQKAKESYKAFLERLKDDVQTRTDWYFIRQVARFEPSEIQKWADTDLTGIMERAINWAKGGPNYRVSSACKMWNKRCEYMDACINGDIKFLNRADLVFPELEPGKET